MSGASPGAAAPKRIETVRALRWAMVGLVVINLGFVALTEAARAAWLIPLFGATLAAPRALPLVRFVWYRAGWNALVIGAFALLVHHVTSAGIDRLLEDGLLLAALCQVHLLSNLRHEQKPDLLFFNSFLIAVMTSFLSFDLPYCLLLFVYVPALIISLDLLTRVRFGEAETVDRSELRRFVGRAFGRGLAVLSCAFLLFFVVPRDFKRRGLVGDWAKAAGTSFSRVDFSEEIEHRDRQGTPKGGRTVAWIHRARGTHWPRYWRGSTLDAFDGKRWTEQRPPLVDRPWRRAGKNRWARASRRPLRATFHVRLRGPVPTCIFVPLEAEALHIQAKESWRAIRPKRDLTFRHVRRLRHRIGFRYGLYTADGPLRRPVAVRGERRALRTHLALPDDLSPVLTELGLALARAEGEPPADYVARVCAHLAAEYRYLAPGAEGAAGTLESFLTGEADGGHCELFASAAALALRLNGVPCRIVTGYRLVPPTAASADRAVLRTSDAHAWLEVYDPRHGGWMTVDPTPAAIEAGENPGWVAATMDAVSRAWRSVTGFDDAGRAKAWAWITSVFDGLQGLVLAGGAIVLILALVALRRRRAGEAPSVRRYRRAVRAVGLAPSPGETPRELLNRARGSGAASRRLDVLERATLEHERARYAGRQRAAVATGAAGSLSP